MRIKATIAYDGTRYVGFQIQKNGNSIQAELQKALFRMTKGIAIPVYASGRTDSGVHAKGQVIHFDYPARLAPEQMQRALNSLLPGDIVVVEVKETLPDFNAQYHAEKKRYCYTVCTNKVMDPFRRLYQWHHPYRVNLEAMQEALSCIPGTHDFSSFCSTKTDKEDKVRTVYRADVKRQGDCLIFTFEGKGFLYNMVRILVGTSIQIGDGLKPVSFMAEALEAKNRKAAGPTAPSQGLVLEKVWYPACYDKPSIE